MNPSRNITSDDGCPGKGTFTSTVSSTSSNFSSAVPAGRNPKKSTPVINWFLSLSFRLVQPHHTSSVNDKHINFQRQCLLIRVDLYQSCGRSRQLVDLTAPPNGAASRRDHPLSHLHSCFLAVNHTRRMRRLFPDISRPEATSCDKLIAIFLRKTATTSFSYSTTPDIDDPLPHFTVFFVKPSSASSSYVMLSDIRLQPSFSSSCLKSQLRQSWRRKMVQ